MIIVLLLIIFFIFFVNQLSSKFVVCICVYAYMCICVYVYMCIRVYVHMCTCVYLYMCVCVSSMCKDSVNGSVVVIYYFVLFCVCVNP